jgi:hypothetical protein
MGEYIKGPTSFPALAKPLGGVRDKGKDREEGRRKGGEGTRE